MGLIAKLTLVVAGLTSSIMLIMSLITFTMTHKEIEKSVHQQLNGTLELLSTILKEQNLAMASINETTARNQDLPALVNYHNLNGLTKMLDRVVHEYPAMNYILVVGYNGNVLSRSTIHPQPSRNNKLSELRNVESSPKLAALLKDHTVSSMPGQDDWLPASTTKEISQWIVSPIKANNRLVGWVIASYNWKKSYQDLIEKSLNQLKSAYLPVSNITLQTRTNKPLLLSADNQPTQEKMVSASKFLQIGLADYNLTISFSEKSALHSLDNIQFWLATLELGTVLLLSFSLFFLLKNIIVKPITSLKNHINMLGAKGLDYVIPPTSSEELSSIASSINALASQLKSTTTSVSRLDEEIKEKEHILAVQETTKQKLSAILDTAADGIITLNSEGHVLTFNQAAQTIFGYSEQEMLHQPIERLMDDGTDSAKHRIRDYLNSGVSEYLGNLKTEGALSIELNALGKSRVRFPILLSIARVATEQGVLFSAIVKDITESKEAEAKLIESKEKAEQAAKIKSEFLAVMSHEIRTPMNGVIGMLELLMENNLNNSQQHQAYLAHNSAVSLLNIINDILDFSKIEADKLELESHHFDLRRVLGDFCESTAASLSNPDIEIVLDTIEVNQTMVLGDSSRIRQIFANLVGNAVKFTQAGEIIVTAKLVELSENQWTLQASVSDSGIGIPTDKIANLFDKFSQVDASTTRKYGGTGLGLAIVKKLCLMMDGNIQVTSEVGKGSTFSFEIQVGKSNQAELVVPKTDISKLSILVVDDNAVNREVLCKQLEHWGAHVSQACDKESTLAQFERASRSIEGLYDIAFLDMQMPECDGLELCKAIRLQSEWQQTKLIMMTSMESIANNQEFKALGFSGYFAKPATTSDLFNALNVIGSDDFSDKDALVTHNYLTSLKTDTDAAVSNTISDKTKILVVEDNRVNQVVIRGVLKQLDVQVVLAENGKQAIEKLSDDQEINLILMDCQMPEMDGYEATQRIRLGEAGELHANTPIVAMTANAMESDRQDCLNAGMNDFLTKPINKALVIKKIHQWSNLTESKAS
ncbi:response regulator [Vibrio sp. S4M6]|uniref:response regulator n=1 Tax=Vibrio sinus TaxID=2946865 RepID=UPI002029EFB2|nr:response regulator [Vibrio sinus]MCL9783049.1 response regulator [Vibrio sinus]